MWSGVFEAKLHWFGLAEIVLFFFVICFSSCTGWHDIFSDLMALFQVYDATAVIEWTIFDFLHKQIFGERLRSGGPQGPRAVVVYLRESNVHHTTLSSDAPLRAFETLLHLIVWECYLLKSRASPDFNKVTDSEGLTQIRRGNAQCRSA